MKSQFPTSWAGTYRYDESAFMPQPSPVVAFEMTISLGWFGRFTGSIAEVAQGVPEAAIVWGRIRAKTISFRKRYPSFWMADENGENIRVSGLEPFVLYYRGEATTDLSRMEGVWEIPAGTRYIEEHEWEFPAASGTWEATAKLNQ